MPKKRHINMTSSTFFAVLFDDNAIDTTNIMFIMNQRAARKPCCQIPFLDFPNGTALSLAFALFLYSFLSCILIF